MNKKLYINGIIREMTEQEQAEYNALTANLPEPEPTAEQRIEELENALIELASIIGGMC